MKLTTAQTRCLDRVANNQSTAVKDGAVYRRLVAMGLIVHIDRAHINDSSYSLTPAGGRAAGYIGPALNPEDE